MIRLIHNLGGCGGTLLSRCLGVLPGVALFSEINPAAVRLFPHFDPIYQDSSWVHLLEQNEAERFSQLDLRENASFSSFIATLLRRAAASARHLVLRDFNYIDFLGTPFTSRPSRRMTIYEALPADVPVKSIAFVRDPSDQWVSLSKHEELTASLTPEVFCDGYACFLEHLDGMRIYRYEDFVAAPEQQLKDICKDLDLPFDSSFLEKFHSFDSVTGDFVRIRETSISLPRRKKVSPAVIERFNSMRVFQQILKRTGYAKPAN